MEYTKLSKTDLKLSRIGLGTWQFSEAWEKYGKTPAQVALNWLIMYSPLIVPIPGAKKPEHVIDNAGAVDWRLSYDD